MLSAKEILKGEKQRSSSKKQFYVALLEQFSRKIKTSSDLGNNTTILTVQPFMIGFPKYELAPTVMYMVRQLQRLGYHVMMVGPLDIRVSWAKKEASKVEIIDHAHAVSMPSLMNLSKTAQKLRVIKSK